MSEFPAILPPPSDPSLIWALADQVWAWRYPPLRLVMRLGDDVQVEGNAEDLLTCEQHMELAAAIRAAAAQVTEAGGPP